MPLLRFVTFISILFLRSAFYICRVFRSEVKSPTFNIFATVGRTRQNIVDRKSVRHIRFRFDFCWPSRNRIFGHPSLCVFISGTSLVFFVCSVLLLFLFSPVQTLKRYRLASIQYASITCLSLYSGRFKTIYSQYYWWNIDLFFVVPQRYLSLTYFTI